MRELSRDLSLVLSANLSATHRDVHYKDSEVQLRGMKTNEGKNIENEVKDIRMKFTTFIRLPGPRSGSK